MKSTDGQLLSCREREVLQLVAEGKTSNQIAENLHISAKTVENHRQQVMLKLNIKNVAALTKYAVREGLTML
jgi:DNA-binding NarL/FixJ family response regulator